MGNISLDNINSYDTDYKNDICNDVYERVIAEFKEKINQMLPEIIENIKNEIKSEYQNKLNALTARIDKLENSSAKTAATSVTSSAILQKSYVRNGFKYGDWIFYRNEDNGNFLYKVKKDGSQNTKLTDYSIFENIISIRDGYLCVLDSICNERQIKL